MVTKFGFCSASVTVLLLFTIHANFLKDHSVNGKIAIFQYQHSEHIFFRSTFTFLYVHGNWKETMNSNVSGYFSSRSSYLTGKGLRRSVDTKAMF